MIVALTAPRLATRDRRGFTLVELLIAMSIIVILASMTLFALQSVIEDAKEARTRAQIAKLNELLMYRWEGYRWRAVPIRILPRTSPTAAAVIRLNALHELMRMELPDRKSDVADPPRLPAANGIKAPALWRAYRRRVAATVGGPTWTTDPLLWTPKYQGAECLYMIVASIQEGDSNGLDFFKPNEIGDVDEDGMFEILDGWGIPIEFLRWAPGYPSDVQDRDPVESPDPFDPLGVNAPSYLLHPLIFSAGRDKSFDIFGVIDFDSTVAPPKLQYSTTTPLENNPYFAIPDAANPEITFPLGTPMDVNVDNWLLYSDNVTNHAQEPN